ncbi:histidine kinase [Wenyingzhuangia sp. IMCC45467]
MKKSVKNIFISFVIGCAVFVVGNVLFTGFPFNTITQVFNNFLQYQLYSLVLGYLNLSFFDYLNELNWTKKSFVKRILIGFLGSIIISFAGLFLIRSFLAVFYKGETFQFFISKETFSNYQFGLWISLTIVIVFHFIYFYNKYQQNRIKEQKVIAGTASAKFNALKNQLDPHFLFNSLNVLTSLIEENPKNAQKFTTSLSKVYRYVLEQKNKELILVDEELAFAKTYMSLLKMRFEDSIVFTIPEKASNPESKVVPLSLQLLLENAVKHNVVTATKPLHITIYEEDGFLVVENNLQEKQIVKKSSGVGLNNILERYKLLTNRQVQINKTTDHFAVLIPMLTKQISIMRTTEIDDNSYVKAKEYVENLKGFYYNLVSYILVIPFLIYINYKVLWGIQWFWFPMFGWGLGLAFQAYKTFVNKGVLGTDWEQRKMEEFMRSEENKKWK